MAELVPFMDRRCPHRVDLILAEPRDFDALAFALDPATPGLFGYWIRPHAARGLTHYEYRFSDSNVALEAKLKFG